MVASVADGAIRAKTSVIRCWRLLAIVAPMWWGLDARLAMSSVAAGYGSDGSNTPTICADRVSRRIVLPITFGSERRAADQN